MPPSRPLSVGASENPSPGPSTPGSDSPESAAVRARLIAWFEDLGADDVPRVGGKAASLGEMFGALSGRGVRVPNGFTTTVDAYADFLDAAVPPSAWDEVGEERVGAAPGALGAPTLRKALGTVFEGLNAEDQLDLHARAELARALVSATPVPAAVAGAIRAGHRILTELYGEDVDLAVRSSATCEDSEVASFAGQYESYLNVRGPEGVLKAWQACCASAFTERALGYQIRRGMDPLASGLGVVIMKMVRSDLAASGVMFTLDPDTGNPNVIHITSAYGLGELVVQGSVSPDSIIV